MKGSAQVQVCDAGTLAGLSWLWQFEQLGSLRGKTRSWAASHSGSCSGLAVFDRRFSVWLGRGGLHGLPDGRVGRRHGQDSRQFGGGQPASRDQRPALAVRLKRISLWYSTGPWILWHRGYPDFWFWPDPAEAEPAVRGWMRGCGNVNGAGPCGTGFVVGDY